MPPAAQAKFRTDVLWNIGSLAVAGVSGVALNLLIGAAYDAAALGVFNQVFAAYILGSQLAALGVQYSVLQEVAATDENAERAAITTSALLVATALAVVVAGAFALSSPLLAAALSSEGVEVGMRLVAPAIMFFAIDKITLAALNGARRMRWYAILQGARVALMLPAFAICVALELEASALPIVITLAEGATMLVSLAAARDFLRRLPLAELARRARAHLSFGARGALSGLVAELNTRVDVLMLGYFASDTTVGVYSFAATIAEGIFQLLVVFRQNYAPVCARMLADDQREELRALVRRGRNRTYAASALAAVIAIGGYTLILPLLFPVPVVEESGGYFAVLLAGMFAASGYVPFSQLLLYGRQPGWHTNLMLMTALANIGLNVALISLIGPIGAAVATACSFVIMIALLRLLTARRLNLRI